MGSRSRRRARSEAAREEGGLSRDWPLWEVFVRSKGGLSHRHVGSVHAPDAQLALAHARDTYTRRLEGVSLWVVPSAQIVASDPDQAGELFEPAKSKIYRPPTFYDSPAEGKHIGWPRCRRSTCRRERPARACSTRVLRANRIRHATIISCAWATTRWCLDNAYPNGAVTGRCS